jgi:hypothetical protein
MPIELLMYRRGEALIAAAPRDKDEIERLAVRGFVTVVATQKPNQRLVAWYRALLHRLVEMTEMWPTADQAHRQLLISCGYCDAVIITGRGDVRATPVSTAEWGAEDWTRYIDVLMAKIHTDIIPGIPDQQLRESVEAMAGMSFEQARSEVA